MFGRRLLAVVMIVSLLSIGLPGGSSGVSANPSGACVQLAWYAGEMLAAGEQIDADDATGPDTDHMENWTDADYDTAIAIYDSILATLDAITPPASAVAFHEAIRDGVVLFQQALGVMKTSGPFALLAYLDQFDTLNQRATSLASPLEEQCGVALYDNDDDGELEVGPGVATPAGGDETTAAVVEAPTVPTINEATTWPAGTILPIGLTAQTSDAFSLTIVSVDQNAVDAVPDPPPDGYQYVNAEIELGHVRDQTDTFDLGSLLALGPGGSLYSAVGNSCGLVNGPLASGDYTGTMSMTGLVCFVVNSRDVAGLTMFDQTQNPAERVYLSLDPERS